MSESWPPYPLEIPPELLRKLAPLQKKAAKSSPLCRSESAILICSGLGPPAYLTLGGEIFQDNGFEGGEPSLVYASEEKVGAYLLIGAWSLKLPELMDLLPPGPEGTETCPECEGAKAWDPSSGERPRWCRRCGSRGWTYIIPRPKVLDGPPYQRRPLLDGAVTKKWWQRILPGKG